MQNTQAKDDAMAALDDNFEFNFADFDESDDEPATSKIHMDSGVCTSCAE